MILYIAAAIGLQALIAFGMNIHESIKDFFFSLQMQSEITEDVLEEGAGQRIMGYGIAFFGAGAVAGLGLIMISYLLMRIISLQIWPLLIHGMSGRLENSISSSLSIIWPGLPPSL